MGRKYSREPQGELDRLMIAMYDADIGMDHIVKYNTNTAEREFTERELEAIKGLIEDFPGIAEWTGSSDAG